MNAHESTAEVLVADADGNFYRVARASLLPHAVPSQEINRLIAEAGELVREERDLDPSLAEAWRAAQSNQPDVQGQSVVEHIGLAAQLVSLGLIAWRIRLQKETVAHLRELREFKQHDS